jgi:uncharacterized membrane protein
MERNKVHTLVLYALFVGMIFVLGLTPIGLIPLPFINVTILHIPTIIGTILLGGKAGLLFGFFFGTVSFIRAPTSGFAGMLYAENIFFTILMCYIPRLLVPVITHVVYRFLAERKSKISVTLAAVCGSLTNTIGYLGLMLLFFALCGLDSAAVLGMIGTTGVIAGPLEAIAAAIIATPLVAALKRMKYFQ